MRRRRSWRRCATPSAPGQGQAIDCALLDTQVAVLANQGMSWLVGGVIGERMGNRHPTVVPYRVFRARDRAMVVAVGNDGQYRALCRALDRKDLLEDPRFLSNSLRIAHRDVLEADLGGTIVRFDAAELTEKLVAAGVPAGPINRVDQVFADPQVRHREVVHLFTRDDGVDIPTVGYPPRLSVTGADYRRPPPRLGEHTFEVLEADLGLSQTEIERLVAGGAIAGF